MSAWGQDTCGYYRANAEYMAMQNELRRARMRHDEEMRKLIETLASERAHNEQILFDGKRMILIDPNVACQTIDPTPAPVVQAVPEVPWWEKLDQKERVSRETALEIEARGQTWDEYWTGRAG